MPKQATGLINRLYKAWNISHAARKDEQLWLNKYAGTEVAIARLRPFEQNWLLLGVATCPKQRGAGHASRLIQAIMQHNRGQVLYCFALEELSDWYVRLGWQQACPSALQPPYSGLFASYQSQSGPLIPFIHCGSAQGQPDTNNHHHRTGKAIN